MSDSSRIEIGCNIIKARTLEISDMLNAPFISTISTEKFYDSLIKLVFIITEPVSSMFPSCAATYS